MNIEARLVKIQVSGHNPDIPGHGYTSQSESIFCCAESSAHKPVYQSTKTSDPGYKTNSDIIRTYTDMTLIGLKGGVPQGQVCSPYSGSRIDISGTPATYPPENQGTQKSVPQTPVLHITPSIFQSTPPHPFFSSPYRGEDLDITGGSISSWPEPQPVTSSGVRTAVLHIASLIQHIGAHHRQQPAFRVSDRSGTPQAGNPAEEYSGERDPEDLRGDTPKKNTHP